MADTTCAVSECERLATKRGWCDKHYRRWKKHGDPLTTKKLANGTAPDHCTVDGCRRPYHARGLCGVHYGRQRYNGDPAAGQRLRCSGAVAERLEFHSEPQPDGCIHWTGSIASNGYGCVTINGKRRPAHVVAYEHAVGPVPEGMDLDHTCHNAVAADCTCGPSCMHRRCINTDHLLPSTRSENMLRAFAHKRRPCSVEGCGKPHHSRGYCNAHYYHLHYRVQGVAS